MKNLFAFLFLTIFLVTCTPAPEKPPVENSLSDAEKAAIGKQLVIDSFDKIFSDLDTSRLDYYYTDDFILLENGIVWNNDSIVNFQRRSLMREERPTRINKFDFFETKIQDKSVWLAYHNNATFFMNKEQVGEANWLESVVATETEKGWRLEMMHSTYVQKQK